MSLFRALRPQPLNASSRQASSKGSWLRSMMGGTPSRLQQLYDRASVLTEQGPLRDAEAAELSALMGVIPLDELGFSSEALKDPGRELQALQKSPRLAAGHSRITYMSIAEDERLTLGIFCFPERATIPLHNHPGMTVLSRLLFGTLQVTAYDLVQPSQPGARSEGLHARKVFERAFSAPADTLVLYPAQGGNIHEFTALTPCAVLDLLAPPYDPYAGRDCDYFKLTTDSSDVQQPVLVRLPESPDTFEVVRTRYGGLPVR